MEQVGKAVWISGIWKYGIRTGLGYDSMKHI